MAQPFDAGRLELTGRAVQLADQVSTNIFDGLFSVSNTGVLAYAATGGRQSAIDLVRPARERSWATPGEPTARDEMALSPDGTRVVEGRVDDHGTWAVWMLDLARGTNTRLSFEGGGGSAHLVARWQPDYLRAGRRSIDGPVSQARQRRGTGRSAVAFRRIKTPDDWSRDGRFLLFMQRGKDHRRRIYGCFRWRGTASRCRI